MVVLFDRERLESTLPYVPAAFIVPVIAPNVRGQQPLHPTAQVAVAPGPKHQVEVVRHERIPKHRAREAVRWPLRSGRETTRSRRPCEKPPLAHYHGSARGSTFQPRKLGQFEASFHATAPRPEKKGTFYFFEKVECPLYSNTSGWSEWGSPIRTATLPAKRSSISRPTTSARQPRPNSGMTSSGWR